MNRAHLSTALAAVIALLAATGFARDVYRHDVAVFTTATGALAVLVVVFRLAEGAFDSLLLRGPRDLPDGSEES